MLTLSALLALVLFITGIEMLVSGINGRTWLGNVVKAFTDDVKKMAG